MADLVKGVLGGGWSLVVGWILPVFVTLQLVTVLVLPTLPHSLPAYHHFATESAAAKQLTLLAVAAVAGLVLAAFQAPLYRLLEGYAVLWPSGLAEQRINRHRARRDRLVAKQEAMSVTQWGVQSGLLYQRAGRYPASDRQFAPTLLGNSIRRFETYAGDRFMMDSQLLWNDLAAAAPPATVDAVVKARANVDFFVCLIYGAALTALAGVIASVSAQFSVRTGLAIGIGVVLIPLSYMLAVIATDEWDAAFRAVVDLGRSGVASAFGIQIPDNFDDERLMWRAINTLVRRPYSYSQRKDVAALITRFRSTEQPTHVVMNPFAATVALAEVNSRAPGVTVVPPTSGSSEAGALSGTGGSPGETALAEP
jgi:hypothetical protein